MTSVKGRSPVVSLALVVMMAWLSHDSSGSPATTRFSFREIAMGCEVRIALYASNAHDAERFARAAFDRIHKLDLVLSDYAASSEVRRLPDRAQEELPISSTLSKVIAQSISVARATNGAFDLTAGGITRIWREARAHGTIPSDAAIAAALACGGWNSLALTQHGTHLLFSKQGTTLDFGGIGKGLAAQLAVETLRELGITQAMCAVAGDIACGDAPPGEPGWRIEIDCGLAGAPAQSLCLSNRSISTSGDAEQHLDARGVRYSHIYDPRTGRAVTRRVASSVISRDGALADALATALCVDGHTLLMSEARLRATLGGFEATVIELDSLTGQPRVTTTTGWPTSQASPPEPAAAVQTAATAASDSSGGPARHPK